MKDENKQQLARIMTMEYFKQNNLFNNEENKKSFDDIVKEFLVTEKGFYDALGNNSILAKKIPNTK